MLEKCRAVDANPRPPNLSEPKAFELVFRDKTQNLRADSLSLMKLSFVLLRKSLITLASLALEGLPCIAIGKPAKGLKVFLWKVLTL